MRTPKRLPWINGSPQRLALFWLAVIGCLVMPWV
jgi:hypothetical protein